MTESYRWLGQMTDLERKIARDAKRILRHEVAMLKAEAAKRAEPAEAVAETKAFLTRP